MGCSDRILKEVWSSERNVRVVVFERLCGATADDTQQLILSRSKDVDTQRADTALVITSEMPLEAMWVDNDTVEVHIPPGSEIHRSVEFVDGVNLIYR